MRRILKWAVVWGVISIAAGGTQADVVNFAVFENAQGASTQGLNLNVELIAVGSTVDFTFRNQSTIPSVVTAVYFESNALSTSLLTGGMIVLPQPGGVNFVIGATPPNPPGSIAAFGGVWGGNLLSIDAAAPPPHNGMGPGESVTVRFSLAGSFQSLIEALSTDPPGFRMVQHVQALPGGASVWTVNQPVPGAGTGAALLTAGLVIARRRRRSSLMLRR